MPSDVQDRSATVGSTSVVVVDGRYDGGWRRRDDALFLVLYFLYRLTWVGLRFIGHFIDLSLLLVVVQRPVWQFGRIWQIGEGAGAAQEEAGGGNDDNATQPLPRGACSGVVGSLPCCPHGCVALMVVGEDGVVR